MISILELITPTNLNSEKDRFLSSNSSNPVFEYIWQTQKIVYSSSNINKTKLVEGIIHQDIEKIVQSASKLYEVSPNEALTQKAHLIINEKPTVTHSGTAKEYASLLMEAFKIFNLNYKVIISPESGFNARPDHKQKQVIISEQIHYEMFSMEGGVRHELVHAIRSVNGKYNQIKRSRNYLPTEEGLASYAQDNVTGVIDQGKAQHAIEYLGTVTGLAGSLREIYNFMLDSGMSKDLSWKRACRHKFGFVDTSQAGDILKPAMYFVNEEKVSNLSNSEKIRLFVGKIAIDDLGMYPDYSGVWPQSLLKEYFNL